MGYIESNLMPNEQVLYKAKVHPAVFLRAIFGLLFSGLLLIYYFYILGTINKEFQATQQVSDINGVMAFFVLFLVVFMLFVTLLLGIQAWLTLKMTEFGVTDKRVIAKVGFIRRHTIEILLSKIESVGIHQGITGRVLGFGTITITGTGGTKERFYSIDEPLNVRKIINQVIEDSQSK